RTGIFSALLSYKFLSSFYLSFVWLLIGPDYGINRTASIPHKKGPHGAGQFLKLQTGLFGP
ncbi:MAG: hypothetical protein VXX14_02175, partial [Pseudomonadota bacterium]|nr:hypothetical protein [Pseudomonadota bacterium]